MQNEPQRYYMSAPTGIPNPYEPPRNPWHVGHLIYFERADPRSFVPKYSGIGFTFNFARASSLWVTLLPLLILGAALLITILTVHHFVMALVVSLLLPLLLFILFLILFLIHVINLLGRNT